MDDCSKSMESRDVIHTAETAAASVKMSGGGVTRFSDFESDSEEETYSRYVTDETNQQNTHDIDTGIPDTVVDDTCDIVTDKNKTVSQLRQEHSKWIEIENKDSYDDYHLSVSGYSEPYRKRSSAFSYSLPDVEYGIAHADADFDEKAPRFISDSNVNGNVMGRSCISLPPHTPTSACSDTASESSSFNVREKIQQGRFNPFNRDLHVEDDHFSDTLENYFSFKTPRTSSDSTRSGSFTSDTSTDIVGPMSGLSDADEITYADLGLAENHFSHPEGHFGLSNTEEIDMAIETCIEMIKSAPQNSDKQKNLVRKLVHLRMKKQELKEGPEDAGPGVKVVVGHKFKERTSHSSRHYCEKCNTVIWGMLQTWYRCTECSYCCHAKCLILITRTCARVKVRENPSYCLSICPQKGLALQNYRCAECKSPISFKSGGPEPRLCDYTGNYYCEFCHWNDDMVIPARVLHNWDFVPRKVCRASKQFLRLMTTKAVIRIQDINPMLFNFVEELSEIKKLREEMLIMKKYILLCPVAMEKKVLLLLQKRQHFVDGSDIYSMKDLMDIQTDSLFSELAQVHSTWAQHIKTDCQLCQGRGFICELCDDEEVLFPFDNIAVVCSQCSNVIHRYCFAKRGGQCPKCERRDRRKAN